MLDWQKKLTPEQRQAIAKKAAESRAAKRKLNGAGVVAPTDFSGLVVRISSVVGGKYQKKSHRSIRVPSTKLAVDADTLMTMVYSFLKKASESGVSKQPTRTTVTI